MPHGRHWFRSGLLALLALAVLAGGSFAAGDLFDDDYADCPHRTRLRDGQIADLTISRDAEEADEVNVAWAATDPVTWGLGANAYSTSLVVILDDGGAGDPVSKTLSLGTRKATFEGVAKGREVTVQLAIVVDTAEGDYLISDILEQSINQSLSAPSFSTDWIIRGVFPCYRDRERADIPLDDLADDAGRMYYIGYNENFGNYRSGGDWPFNTFTTKPETPRLRIGLAHGGEDDDAREDVKFDTYLLRLIDEDGDIVAEGDDVPTMASDYGQTFQEGFIIQNLVCTEGYYDNYLVLGLDYNTENGYTHINFQIPQGEQQRANLLTAKPINNVRINDGGAILPAAHQNASLRKSADHAAPSTMVTSVNVDSHRAGIYLPPRRTHIGISRSIPWSRTGPTPSKPGPSTRTARY